MGFDQGVVSPCRTTKPGRFWLCLVHRSTHTRLFLKHRRRRRARTRKLDLDLGCRYPMKLLVLTPAYASVIAASRLGAAATFRAERSSAFAIAVSRTAAAGASRSMFCLISTRARSRAQSAPAARCTPRGGDRNLAPRAPPACRDRPAAKARRLHRRRSQGGAQEAAGPRLRLHL